MKNEEIFKDLFDKKMLRIITLFTKYPEKQFQLSDISKYTEVNPATTFRIINKLALQGFIDTIKFGKIKAYRLSKGEKAQILTGFLKSDSPRDALRIFVDKIKDSRVRRVILDSRGTNNARLLIVGEIVPGRVEKLVDQIKREYEFTIEVVEITDKQYDSLRKFRSFNFAGDVLYEHA